jgi:hypothetical protein
MDDSMPWKGARLAARRRALVGLLALAATAAARAQDPAPAPPDPAPADEAPAPKVLFFLDQVRGQPGESVGVTLSVETNAAIAAVSFAINFDERSLFLESAERILLPANPVPAAGERSTSDLDNRDERTGDQLEEGWVRIDLAASDTTRNLGLPTGVRVPLFKLGFRIRANAPSGFAGVGFDDIGPLRVADQLVILTNAAEFADNPPLAPYAVAPEDLFDGGVIIKIIGEVGFFARGDANVDLVRDVSDPVRTLFVLFNGQGYFLCEDAADANYDGRIDVTDPIFSLDCLFSSGKQFPPPEVWGLDPTEDNLGCDES